MKKRLKIYIAGFDVFKSDSLEIGKKYKELCESYGYIGLYPMDNEVNFSKPKKEVAKEIFLANKKMIDSCDIVIANLNPFRGKEADSGTVWECGYGFAKGKKVYGYMQELKPYIENFSNEEKLTCKDKNGMFIEDFDLPINLMIACSIKKMIEGGFEDVLKELSG